MISLSRLFEIIFSKYLLSINDVMRLLLIALFWLDYTQRAFLCTFIPVQVMACCRNTLLSTADRIVCETGYYIWGGICHYSHHHSYWRNVSLRHTLLVNGTFLSSWTPCVVSVAWRGCCEATVGIFSMSCPQS